MRIFTIGGTTFANFYSVYTIDFDPDRPKADEKGKGLIQSDYHPREYNAGKIIEYSLEYDSKANRMWQVFDLGNRLDKHLVAVGAPTGFMEVVGMSGKISSLITIDYKTMLRVPPEYKPLEGDSYVFKKEGHFYPGYESDLASNGYAYEKQKEIGTTTEFPNFFYSAKNPTDKDGRIKSFRMTTRGSDIPLKNTKYSLQTVTERYEIFDYDVANECLIGDMMTIQKFNTNGWRNQHRYMPNGKMLPFGTEINIKDLFDEKVSDSDVEYTVKAYKYSSATQSFSEPVELSGNYFTFNQDINLNFEFRQNGFTKTAQVQLREYIEPEFNLNARAEDNFDESKTYFAGEKYNLPKGTIAKWGANQIRYLNDWYDDKENKKMQNIMYMVRYQKRNGIMHLISSDLKQTEDFVIEQGVKQETWIYYIHNIFGEVRRFEVTLKTEENPKYTITNSAGDKLAEKISRKDKDGNLFPEKTMLVASMDTEVEFKSYGNDTFKYNVVDKTGTFEIYKYYLITSETNEEEYVTGRSAPAVYDEIYEKVKARGGVVNVEYMSGKESFNIQFVVHGMFGDKKELKPIEHTTLFTGHKYMFAEKYIKDKDGNILARNSLEVHYTVDGKALYNSGQYFDVEEIGEGHKYITFKEPGKYRFYYKYYANNMFFIKSIEVEVKSNGGNVEVKYVTDFEHPFKDGSIEKTFTHNLKNEFSFLEEKYFDDKGDYLLGYTYKTTEYKKSPGYPYKIRSYIKEFNSDKIEIKVIWDKGSVVTLNLDKAKTGFDNVVADKVYKQSSKDKKYYFDNKMINVEEIIKKKADDINKKYILVGIKSSIFEGGYISIENYNKGISWRTASNSIEFELVYKRKLKLSYEMDSTYTNSFFKYHDIVEDEVLGEKNYKIPQLKGEYQDTHKFVGWYLKGDISKTIIDFKTFIARLSQANANGVITVVAKFETK